MKKGFLTSIVCFTSLLFSSCGTTKVKVTLIGDEHIGWEKTSDIADVTKDYSVKAISKVRGYVLYSHNIEVVIGGVPAYLGQAFTFDSDNQQLTITSKGIIGDIVIKGVGDAKEITLEIVVPESCYSGIQTETLNDITVEDEDYVKTNIQILNSYTPPKKEDFIVTPQSVNFDFKSNGDDTYTFEIKHTEFYQDIKIEFPDLKP